MRLASVTSNPFSDDALVLWPESRFVNEDIHADTGHCAGFNQLLLHRLGVIVEQLVAGEHGLAVFEIPLFQW